mmetsp:Transcript_34106/g.105395  ORF Transcript_34106/g.105395 Transcript_34106/m.105395 type:complete len:249 (+) Transcript_34106:790-1536(+)
MSATDFRAYSPSSCLLFLQLYLHRCDVFFKAFVFAFHDGHPGGECTPLFALVLQHCLHLAIFHSKRFVSHFELLKGFRCFVTVTLQHAVAFDPVLSPFTVPFALFVKKLFHFADLHTVATHELHTLSLCVLIDGRPELFCSLLNLRIHVAEPRHGCVHVVGIHAGVVTKLAKAFDFRTHTFLSTRVALLAQRHNLSQSRVLGFELCGFRALAVQFPLEFPLNPLVKLHTRDLLTRCLDRELAFAQFDR